MCCTSKSKGKESNTKRITIDMKNLQAPVLLYEGIVGGPCLPFVSNLKSH